MRRIHFFFRELQLFFSTSLYNYYDVHFDTYYVFIVNNILISIVVVVYLIVLYNICNYSAYLMFHM